MNIIVSLISLSFGLKIKDFHSIWPWNYKGEGFYSNLNIGVSEPTDDTGAKIFEGLIILALGDFNNDKYTDIVVTSDSQDTLAIYFYDEDDMSYGNVNIIEVGSCKVEGANPIAAPPFQLALICGENSGYDYIKLLEDVTNRQNVAEVQLTSNLMEKGSQPIFMDMNSDTYADIVYNANSQSSGDLVRVLLYDKTDKSYMDSTEGFFEKYVYSNTDVGCPEITQTYKLSIPHFSALSDVNADCISDLYMTVTIDSSDLYGLMFIATRVRQDENETLQYCLVKTDQLSTQGYVAPVLADFDDDSAIDIAFYDETNNGIAVYYNVRGAKGTDGDL